MSAFKPVKTMDLRKTKCPLNFVQTKLALEKLTLGDVLEVWILAESQSTLNIPKSITQEGHDVLATLPDADDPGVLKIFIRKAF